MTSDWGAGSRPSWPGPADPRAGGHLADGAASPQEPLFAARVIYDLLFFFMVIIIVLNLIFGVIIDTFADLRSEKQKKEEILKTTCFICGACGGPARLGPARGLGGLLLGVTGCRWAPYRSGQSVVRNGALGAGA